MPKLKHPKPLSFNNPSVGSPLKTVFSSVDLPAEEDQDDSVKILSDLEFYHLDYPNNVDFTDKGSPYFALDKPPTLYLPKKLPYAIESVHDQARYLSHIVKHLFIAINTLDFRNAIPLTAKDLHNSSSIAQESQLEYRDEENFVDNEEDDFEDDNGDIDECIEEHLLGSSTPASQVQPKSASIVSLKNWTIELLSFIKMKGIIPLDLRIKLIRTFYGINLVQGQNLQLNLYLHLFKVLCKDQKMLKDLHLPWLQLMKQLENYYPHADFNYDSGDRKQFNKLLKLATYANPFFDEKDIPEITERILSNFTSQTHHTVLVVLNSMLPIKVEREYIPTLFFIWERIPPSKSTTELVSILGKVTEEALVAIAQEYKQSLGLYGVFTRKQFETIMYHLVPSLKIYPQSTSIMHSKSSKSNTLFKAYAQIIINSITKDNYEFILDKLSTILSVMANYAHPSNSGVWSSSIAKLCHALCLQLYRRHLQETNKYPHKMKSLTALPSSIKLNGVITDKIIVKLMKVITIGTQSRNNEVVKTYTACLSLLGFINPNVVLDNVITDIYTSFDTVNSSHRLAVALKQCTVLARYMAITPVYRLHLIRLMSLFLEAIDSNDLSKSYLALQFFAATSLSVPFHDLSGQSEASDGGMLAMELTSQHVSYLESCFFSPGDHEEFPIDKELESLAVKSATSSFTLFIKQFFSQLTKLLENLPKPDPNTDNIELKIVNFIPVAIGIIFNSLSIDLFRIFAKEFLEYILENINHEITDVYLNILACIINRDAEYQVPKFYHNLIPRIKLEINENGAGKIIGSSDDISSRDRALAWYVSLLGATMENAHEELLKLADDVLEITEYIMDECTGSAALVFGPNLLTSILSTLTKSSMTERLLIPAYLLEKIDESYWGAFQFDYKMKYLEDKNFTTFKWFLPTEETVEFAVKLLEIHVQKALKNLENLKETHQSTVFQNEFRRNVSYIGWALFGVAELFDPAFSNESDDKLENFKGRETPITVSRNETPVGSSPAGSNAKDEDSNLDCFENVPISSYKEGSKEADADEEGSEYEVFSKENSVTPENETSLEDSPSGICPSLTSRDSKLYRCNYFFGDSKFTKESSPLYHKIHQIRLSIGESLHDICNFLIQYHEADVAAFKSLSSLFAVYICDVGVDTYIQTGKTKDSYRFLTSLYNLPRLRKPYSRPIIGERIELFHQQRLSTFGGTRIVNSIEKQLVHDLVRLSMSVYSDIGLMAQNCLLLVNKKLIGTLGTIVSGLNIVSKAIDDNDDLKVERSLSFFYLKGVRNKIQSNYVELTRYIRLLLLCLKRSNSIIYDKATHLFKAVVSAWSLPSSVCNLDFELINSIKPPSDLFVESQINILRIAKESKRKINAFHIHKLETELYNSYRENDKSWQIQYLILKLLIQIENEYEHKDFSSDVIELIINNCSNEHPLLSDLCLCSSVSIVNKFVNLSLYEHNLSNMHDVDYLVKEFTRIDTTPKKENGNNYINEYLAEVHNLESPKYFFDNKIGTNSLFWSQDLIAIKGDNLISNELDLTPKEQELFKRLGQNVMSKEWFYNIFKTMVQGLEQNPNFRSSHVYFTVNVIQMIVNNYVPASKLCVQDIIDLIDLIYVKDEKATHVLTMELIIGLILGYKIADQKYKDIVCEQVLGRFEKIICNDLSPDTYPVWSILSWWLPQHLDVRRYPKIFKFFTDFKFENTDERSSFGTHSRLGLLKYFISSLGKRYPLNETTFNNLIGNMNSSFSKVRIQVSLILSMLTFIGIARNPSSTFQKFLVNVKNVEENVETNLEIVEPYKSALSSCFERIESLRKATIHMNSQDVARNDYIYVSKTFIKYMDSLFFTQESAAIQVKSIVPYIQFLFKLDERKDVCYLSQISPMQSYLLLPFSLSNGKPLQLVLQSLLNLHDISQDPLWHQILSILDFTKSIFYLKYLILNTEQHMELVNFVAKFLFHGNSEVRTSAAKVLSGMIQTLSDSEVEYLISNNLADYLKGLTADKKKYLKLKTKPKSSKSEDLKKDLPLLLNELHGYTLGIGSYLQAFPYISPIPSWIPQSLSILANNSVSVEGIVGKTAKDLLSTFKKTRQDTWHIDSKFFGQDQLEDLEGVLWKSYFI
ncbi:hypothetical protein LJB42_002508 [Komagataella kurtzmanii]|nr:hypothetical protein LJB42_002508 [Komagataella kurtzmanii]